MSEPLNSGVFQLSIDLALGSHQTALSHHRRRNELALWLINCLDRHSLAATWGLDAMDGSPVLDALMTSQTGHGLALLAQANWFGPDIASRTRARELQHRLEAAAEREVTITTIALHEMVLPHESLETLSRSGIRVVRGAAFATTRIAPDKPHLTRFGIHYVPATNCLPRSQGWFSQLAHPRRIRHAIQRTLTAHGHVHLVVQLQRLLEGSERTLRHVDELVQDVARWRESGQLVAETLAQMHLRRTRQLQGTPSRSVLRPAA